MGCNRRIEKFAPQGIRRERVAAPIDQVGHSCRSAPTPMLQPVIIWVAENGGALMLTSPIANPPKP